MEDTKSGLEKAGDIRSKRSPEYGQPTENMEVYAGLLNAYLMHKLKPGVLLDTVDAVIVGGQLMKISRCAHDKSEDSILDGIGWWDVAYECWKKLKNRFRK